MKLITAIIPEEKLDEVREALIEAEIERITVLRVSGHGRQQEITIACNDAFEDITVDTIIRTARHGEGQVGDGKIFVQDLQDCIRIRTGERGGQAI